jgi:hypothetical protein
MSFLSPRSICATARLRSADKAERLRYARDVLANPAWLAEEFVTTVLRFGEYDNADQHFYGKRAAHTFGASLEATKDLVLRLEALPSVTPVDAGDRQIGGTGHPDVIDVPAPDLAFEYVDRELLLQRTESPASGRTTQSTGAAYAPTSCLPTSRPERRSSPS